MLSLCWGAGQPRHPSQRLTLLHRPRPRVVGRQGSGIVTAPGLVITKHQLGGGIQRLDGIPGVNPQSGSRRGQELRDAFRPSRTEGIRVIAALLVDLLGEVAGWDTYILGIL